jgi:hypothetical protein
MLHKCNKICVKSVKAIVILLINFLIDLEATNATWLILTTSERVHFSKLFTEMRLTNLSDPGCIRTQDYQKVSLDPD